MPHILASFAIAVSLAVVQQVFRSATELVEVDAVVLDRDGQPVRGLTAADFELYDEGMRQEIATFVFVDAPDRTAGNLHEPGLASTSEQRAGAIYLIVLDHLNTPPRTTNLMRRHAREFVSDHMHPSDLAAVVHLGLWSQGLEFSSSKVRLIAAIDAVTGGGGHTGENPTPSLADTGEGHDEAFNLAGLERFEAGLKEDRAARSFQTLAALSEYVSGFTGRRKSMLLFSQGLPTNETALVPADGSRLARLVADMANRDVRSLAGVIALARLTNMSVYTIDSRGLDASTPDGAFTRETVADQRARHGFLRVLAHQTGGRAIVWHNDMSAPFAQIARDNGPYYLLGFHPQAGADASRSRALDVKVARDDVQVFARSGYGGLAEHGRASKIVEALLPAWEGRTMRDLLDRPLPASAAGLPMRAQASVIARSGTMARVLLVVEADGRHLPLEQKGEHFVNGMEIGYLAIDLGGRPSVGRVETTQLAASEDARDAIAREGWRYITTFDVGPGEYQLRVALRETSGGLAGMVFIDLDVADPARAPGLIEGVLIGRVDARRAPVSAMDAALLEPWSMLTLQRTFTPSDTLAAFVGLSSHDDLRVTLRVVSEDGSNVVAELEDVDAARFATGLDPIWIPLAHVPPGRYVVIVSVQPDGGERRVTFEVVREVRE